MAVCVLADSPVLHPYLMQFRGSVPTVSVETWKARDRRDEMTTAGRSHSIFGLASWFHQQSTWLLLRSTTCVVLD